MQGFFSSADSAYIVLIVGSLLVHMCYQLSASVLTHLSAHTLSKKAGIRRLGQLGASYTTGVITTTTLLLVALVTIPGFAHTTNSGSHEQVIVLVTGLAPLIALVTVLWYYRHGSGTRLWLPRPIAEFLLERSRKTKRPFEAFLLGAGTVIGELPFTIAPLVFVVLAIAAQPQTVWLGWSFLYAVLASIPLAVITGYVTSGHSIARVQRWREHNKTFLQWTSGITLILLTLYVTVLQIGANI